MAKEATVSMQDLLDAGCHFGHTRGRWHPAMRPFVYMTRERIHIMDLEQTMAKLKDLATAVENFVAAGNSLVLVGTKRQAKGIIEELGKELDLPYVAERWLGGTLTNFDTMRKAIARMNQLEEYVAEENKTGAAKREQRAYAQELERMERKFGGLKDLKEMPQGLFIIDPSYETNAIKEARRLGLSTFAMLDTSSNPALVDEFVPANDDAAKSIKVIMEVIAAAIKRGQARAKVAPTPGAAEAAVASEMTAEEKPVKAAPAKKTVAKKVTTKK